MAPTRKLTAFRIDDDLIAPLERTAEELDRPISYLIRVAIREWLEKQGALKKSERKRAVTRKRP
jgi:predicted transcriptional regulator